MRPSDLCHQLCKVWVLLLSNLDDQQVLPTKKNLTFLCEALGFNNCTERCWTELKPNIYSVILSLSACVVCCQVILPVLNESWEKLPSKRRKCTGEGGGGGGGVCYWHQLLANMVQLGDKIPFPWKTSINTRPTCSLTAEFYVPVM